MYGLALGIIRSKLALTSSRVAKKPSTSVASRHATTTSMRLLKTIRSRSPPDDLSKSRRFGITGIPLLYFCSTISAHSLRDRTDNSFCLGDLDDLGAGKTGHDQPAGLVGCTGCMDFPGIGRAQRSDLQTAAIEGDHFAVLADQNQLAVLFYCAHQAGREARLDLQPLLPLVAADKQVAAQAMHEQQVAGGMHTKQGAGIGCFQHDETLRLLIQMHQQSLLAADEESAAVFGQGIQVHTPVVLGALDPGLPGGAIIGAAQDHAKGANDKTLTISVEQHIEQRRSQNIWAGRGPHRQVDFLEHVLRYGIAVVGTLAIKFAQ